MQSIIKPTTLLYFSTGLIALSGFGILFLNEETILAFCFFVFVYLMIRNSEAASLALDEQKSIIKSELLDSLIKGEKAATRTMILVNHREYELTQGLGRLFQDCDAKINRILTIG